MWKEIDGKLYQKFEFKNFNAAFAFISSVALVSEKADHHPTITNTYSKVEIWLTTHDAGNTVTKKDRDLALQIDKVLDFRL